MLPGFGSEPQEPVHNWCSGDDQFLFTEPPRDAKTSTEPQRGTTIRLRLTLVTRHMISHVMGHMTWWSAGPRMRCMIGFRVQIEVMCHVTSSCIQSRSPSGWVLRLFSQDFLLLGEQIVLYLFLYISQDSLLLVCVRSTAFQGLPLLIPLYANRLLIFEP